MRQARYRMEDTRAIAVMDEGRQAARRIKHECLYAIVQSAA